MDFKHSGSAYMFLPLYSVGGWLSMRVESLGRHELHQTFPECPKPSGFGMVKAGTATSLLEAAAREGFRQLTVPYLKQLWSHLKVPGARYKVATTEAQLVGGLVRHVLPGLQPREYEEMVAKRGVVAEVQSTWSTLLTEDNVALLGETMDSEHWRDLMDDIKKVTKPKETPSAASTTTPSTGPSSRTTAASSSGAGASEAAAPGAEASALRRNPNANREPLGHHGVAHTSCEAAKEYLPRIQGCNLVLEELWHARWKCTYPRQEPPRMVSRSFGETCGVSSEDALSFVLRTVWGWHTAQTGEPCPWQF